MSRPAKPPGDGEYASHRLQYYFPSTFEGHVDWLKTNRAKKQNGVKTLSALVGVLLSREFDRLGVTDDLVLEEEQALAKRLSKKKRKT
jgi:hypothetical protein